MALTPALVAGDGRGVIHHKRPVKAHLLVGLHRPEHIDVAFVDKDLPKILGCAAHVAEVDVGDFALATHAADALVHVNAHFGDAALTEQHGVLRTGVEGEDALVLVEGGDNPRCAAHRLG